MSEISSLIENKKVRKIEVSGFRLKGHLLRIMDAMIYVENISMISASSLPFPPVPVWAFLCLGIGFLVWKSQEMQRYYGHMDSVSYMAVMLMLVGIGIIIKWIYNAYDNSKSKYLNIVMNSGYTYSIVFRSEWFLDNVINTLGKIFEQEISENTNYSFSIRDCVISGGAVVNSGTINNRQR